MSKDKKLGKTAMSAASRYWRAIAIDAAGGHRIEDVESARTFFLTSFPEFTAYSQVPDNQIQRQLLDWIKEGNQSTLAQLCLKCFISTQIERVCQQLSAQFGEQHGFTSSDLLPFVLDDDHKQYTPSVKPLSLSSYQSLSDEILQTFDPQQSSLATWTTRRVKHHKELNSFLLEHGVYLVSDWAILNDTTAKQLERIFSQFHSLTRVEIEQNQQLLESYHAVYRTQRLKQRQLGIKSPCSPPTPEQLEQMNQYLCTRNYHSYSPTSLIKKLQTMASYLREYRIYSRGGSVPKNETDPVNLPDTIPYEHDNTIDDETEFLRVYRQEFIVCLDQIIAKVIQEKIAQFKPKNEAKAEQFIKALQLFHCQELSMTKIAPLIGLKAQFHVSRLLKLKAFRADIQRELLVQLRDRVFEQAKTYTEPQNLQRFHQRIDEALNEQITTIIQEAETEASTANLERHHAPSSLFARRLCYYLDIRSQNP